jgi:predicted AlkP superfamily phosphohydrolase/phosphomutase
MSSKPRLLVIGLDGATWDIMTPLQRQGLLPAFTGLMGSGIHGLLESTMPPATFPAWTTFMTGKNPGKHGLYDFTQRIPGTYDLRFTNATFCRAASLWQILSRAGLRVGVMGLPATYPPEDVNGFMISGFDSPVASSIDASFVKPPELYPELRAAVGEYRISDLPEQFMPASWYSQAREKVLHGLEEKARAAFYLYRREPWDCFMVLFGETDTIAHHFWKFYDPCSPRHVPGSGLLAAAIQNVYQRLDAILKEFLRIVWPDTTILVVSDHGFGGIGTKAVSINQWLGQHGFLARRPEPSLQEKGLSAIKQAGLRYLPKTVQQKVFRSLGGRLAGQVEARSRFAGILWERTAAFSEDLNYFPSIHINLKGREPQGTVADSSYEATREAIIDQVLGWQDPETLRPVVARAWKREELYHGPYVDRAPDIVLEFNHDQGYSYLCLPHRYFARGRSFKNFRAAELSGERILSMSGAHRPEGILLCAGEALSRAGSLDCRAGLQDICPTILSLFGLAPDVDMDGRPLNIFKDLPARSASGNRRQPHPVDDMPYTAQQEKKLADRLRGLGYFD